MPSGCDSCARSQTSTPTQSPTLTQRMLLTRPACDSTTHSTYQYQSRHLYCIGEDGTLRAGLESVLRTLIMPSKQTRSSRSSKAATSAGTKYRRDYDLAGLRDLVQQRVGLKPAKGKSKKFYVDILIQDDAMKAANTEAGDKTFPFLDLPAELRNEIYHCLLVAEPNPVTGRTAGHPEILRTCKQIHEEATGILHNKHTLKLKFRAGRKGGLKRDVRTTCSQTVLTFHSSRASKLSDFLDWPMHLFRIRSLDIDLELGTDQEVVLMAANHALFGLGDRLAHHRAIKQLDVFCHICSKLVDDPQGREALESVLWPLAMLAATSNMQDLVEGATRCDDVSTMKGFLLQLAEASKREYAGRDAYITTQAELAMVQKARRLQKRFVEQRMEKDARARKLDELITPIANILHGKAGMDRGQISLMISSHEALRDYIESDDTLKNDSISRHWDWQGEKDKSGLSWSKFLTRGTSEKAEAIWCGLRK